MVSDINILGFERTLAAGSSFLNGRLFLFKRLCLTLTKVAFCLLDKLNNPEKNDFNFSKRI